MDIKSITGNYEEFLDKIFTNLQNVGIDVTNYKIDHIAYRADTIERYREMKTSLFNFSVFIGENIIRNRPIGIFKLNQPLTYQKYTIPFFEVLAPADGDKPYGNRLEHAEFVVKENLKNFMDKYSTFNFKSSLERKIGPELIAIFPDGNNVKFHNDSIDKIHIAQKAAGEL